MVKLILNYYNLKGRRIRSKLRIEYLKKYIEKIRKYLCN